jgi:acetyl-CoA acyltransferase
MNVARIISLRAGLPYHVSAATINRFCSSGLHAIADIAKAIEVGQITLGVGGGVESMSMVPMGGNKPSANPYLVDNAPNTYLPMGLTAEEVASEFGVSREEQDKFSLKSHEKACKAQKLNLFAEEIIGVPVGDKLISVDEGPRADTTLEALAKLKPAFKLGGSVTAGNSSQISDGAAASVLMNKNEAKALKLNIKGYFRAFVTAGVDPRIMGIGPVPAIKKLLKVTGLSINDIDVFEINEAFAAQAVYVLRTLDIKEEKVNPYGGAVALGHPLGCTGARQIATILNYMIRNKLHYGVVSMCIGGGMGAAGLIEVDA